jgi:prevent-host-death family protein
MGTLSCLWRRAKPVRYAAERAFRILYISVYSLSMKDLSITEFRRQCLSLIENLPEEGVVITKHGRPVARVAPICAARKGKRVTLPLLKGKGRPGPLCPDTETPYDLVFD